MEHNKKIRQNIIEILDLNVDSFPENLYLQLCNQLKLFNFETNRIVVNEEDNQSYESTVSTYSDPSIYPSVSSSLLRRRRTANSLENELLRVNRENELLYITNPTTGRKVLKYGRVGKRILRNEVV